MDSIHRNIREVIVYPALIHNKITDVFQGHFYFGKVKINEVTKYWRFFAYEMLGSSPNRARSF